MRTMTIMGYGALDRVPTAYGLRWNVPSLFLSAVRKTVGEPIPGWQHLWTHLAGFLDVRLNTTISAVTRGGEGSDFLVESDQGSFVFDHLVLTGPLDEAARWFPFTAEERLAWGIGGEVQWREYVTTLVDAEGGFGTPTRARSRRTRAMGRRRTRGGFLWPEGQVISRRLRRPAQRRGGTCMSATNTAPRSARTRRCWRF